MHKISQNVDDEENIFLHNAIRRFTHEYEYYIV